MCIDKFICHIYTKRAYSSLVENEADRESAPRWCAFARDRRSERDIARPAADLTH